jgi:hypothetical protein
MRTCINYYGKSLKLTSAKTMEGIDVALVPAEYSQNMMVKS